MSRVSDAVAETGSSLATVFRNPGLRRINLAFAGSSIGDWAYATAITVWAYQVGGVAAVGIWGTIRYVLMAVVTPFAALLVDRFPRKVVMVTSDITRAVLVLAAALLIWKDAPSGVVFVLATLAALVGAPFRPAVGALLPALVRKPEELTAANGTISTLESLSFFIGPAIGGILLTVADIPVVIVFNGITFLWSALLVWGIHAAAPEAPPSTDPEENAEEVVGNLLHESMEGFRTIFADRDLTVITLVSAAQTVVAGASLVFGVEIAVQMTSLGAEGIGYLDSAMGIGAILGGLTAIARASARRVASDFGWGVVFWALPLILVAAFPSMWPAFIAMFVIGLANPLVDVNLFTMLQRLVDDRVLGRVFGAVEAAFIAGMALGSLIMPLLVQVTGLRWALLILALAITAIVVPAFPRFRRLDAQLGEPDGLELLRSLPLFSPLDQKSLEQVAQQLKRVHVEAGETVIREGDEGDRFYVVETGRLTASFQGRSLSQQGPGDPFGEIALLRNVPRTATVTADEPSVLFALDREPFLDAVTGNSEVSGRAEDLVSRRIPTY